MKTITWVLAHEPYDLFLRAAEVFSQEILQETQGRFCIEVLGLDAYNQRQQGQALTTHASDRERVVALVESGQIDIATVYVNTLGQLDHNLWALSMPFLFRDHDHAQKVLDGTIGRGLMQSLANHSVMQGLAFTYSGGFRIIPSRYAIESVRDFWNMTLRTGKNPVALDTFAAVGARPIGMLIDEFADALERQEVSAGETTYPRFFTMKHDRGARYINHTEHSLFLTAIVMNSRLWQGMSAADQSVFQQAAVSAARIEREESLADIQRVQAQARQQGIETVVMAEVERRRWAEESQSVYAKYRDYFHGHILDDIKSVR